MDKQGRMLSLDELAEMTRKQQEEENDGSYDIVDGRRIKRVATTDLTSDDTNPNPYENYMESVISQAPLVQPGDTITMDDPNQGAQAYQPSSQPPLAAAKQSLKPVSIPDIAPYKPIKKVGEEHMNELVSKLDQAIERDKQQMWDNVVNPLYEKLEEDHIYGEDSSEDSSESDESYDATSGFVVADEDSEDDFGFEISKPTPVPIKADDFFKNDTPTAVEDTAEPDMDLSNFYVEEEKEGDNETMNNDNETPTFVEPEVLQEAEVEVKPEPAPIKLVTPKPIPAVIPPVVEVKKPKVIADDIININSKTIETSITDEDSMDLDSLQDSDLDEYFENAEKDEDDDDGYELTDEDKKENLDEIKKIIKSQVRPVSNIINLSEYSISSKATTTSKVLSEIGQHKNVYSANWCLYNIGRPFTMTGFDGAEIDKLNPSAETGLEELARMKELYGIFYDHITDSNKPSTFDAWAKTIPYDDIDHLYFGAYRASFGNGSNLIPHICTNPKCKHQFMEHHTMDQMVKFKDDEAKERLRTILSMDPTGEKFNIRSKLYQVTDTICIAFRTPTLYSVVFERITLPQKFRDKFSDLVFYINCIEGIYKIDRSTKQLVPMRPKVEVQNIVKTTQNKYKAYAAVLQQLTSDQYYSIPAYIRDMREDHTEELKYIVPESICPKCNHKVEEKTMSGMELLFTRHHLQTVLVL